MFYAVLTLGESCFLLFLIAELYLLLVITEECLHVSEGFLDFLETCYNQSNWR